MQRLLDLLPAVESDADVNWKVNVDVRTALGLELCNNWNFSEDPIPAFLVLNQASGFSENGGGSFLSFGLHV